MNIRRTSVMLGALASVCAPGCAARRVATPAPQSPELVVLLADPDNGATGRASVATPSGTVDLVGDRSATQVLAGRPPTAPNILDATDVQRVFGDALAALPLAPALFNLYFKCDSDVSR